MLRNECSPWSGIRVHHPSEWMFIILRNAHLLVWVGVSWGISVKRKSDFRGAMQAKQYEKVAEVSRKLAPKWEPAAKFLEYWKARTEFDTVWKLLDLDACRKFGGSAFREVETKKTVGEEEIRYPYEDGKAVYEGALPVLIKIKEDVTRKQVAALKELEQLKTRVKKDVEHVCANMSPKTPVGNVVESFTADAMDAWQKAADSGIGEGMVLVGLRLQFGIGCPKDATKGEMLIRKAAVLEVGLAEFLCAIDGGTRDENEKGRWMLRAAEHGVIPAQASVGNYYINGNSSFPKDLAKGVMWHRRAAERGDASSQRELGIAYCLGQGVETNTGEGFRWIRKSADAGYSDGEYSLSTLYRTGIGTPENVAQAVYWCRKAAEHGNDGAQNDMGAFYMNGYGVQKDFMEAEKWLQKAVEQGNDMAKQNLEACRKGLEYEAEDAAKRKRMKDASTNSREQDTVVESPKITTVLRPTVGVILVSNEPSASSPISIKYSVEQLVPGGAIVDATQVITTTRYPTKKRTVREYSAIANFGKGGYKDKVVVEQLPAVTKTDTKNLGFVFVPGVRGRGDWTGSLYRKGTVQVTDADGDRHNYPQYVPGR